MVRIRYIKVLPVLLLPAFLSLSAASDNYPYGSRNAGMAGLGVMMSDFWSVSHNQAGLGFYRHMAIGVHHENRFFVRQFNLHALNMTIPAGNATIGTGFGYFGYNDYNETKLGLGIGKAFHKQLAAGVRMDFLHIHSYEGSMNSSALVAEAGVLARPVGNLWIGFHVYNPTGSRHKGLAGDELIPVILRLGIGYQFGEVLFLGLETERDLSLNRALYRSGLEYRLTRSVYALSGIQFTGEYIQHAFGVEFVLSRVRTGLSFMRHQVLGYTPFLSFCYEIN